MPVSDSGRPAKHSTKLHRQTRDANKTTACCCRRRRSTIKLLYKQNVRHAVHAQTALPQSKIGIYCPSPRQTFECEHSTVVRR